MNLLPDLFSFAYVPGWYAQLDELAELARPEPWRFRKPMYSTKNPDTPILERYIDYSHAWEPPFSRLRATQKHYI